MTMKTKKTLQHIAAVAVVLLTLCLVFAAPVSAAPFTTTVVVSDDTYGTLEEAITAATGTGVGTIISLPDYGCEFTLADDGLFYIDADQKTGRMVYLTIAKAGSSAVSDGTLFNVSTTGEVLLTNKNMHQIMLNSESRLDAKGTLLKNGDILLFPAATIYDDSKSIVDTYGDITFIGAGADKTVICPVSIYSDGYRYFRLYNRYVDNIQSGDIYQFIFKNLTFDGQYNKGAGLNAFVVTCYNIEITAENVVIKNFPGSVFSVWANDKLSDDSYPTKEQNVGVEINLVNVTAKENGRLIHFDPRPYKDDVTNSNDRYGYIKLIYDEQSIIENPELYSINANVALYHGNMLINGEDITLGSAVAQIGDDYYGSLVDAVAAVPTDGTETTITLLKSTEGAGIVTAAGQNVIIDFGEYTYTINELVGSSGTETNGFQLLEGSDVELKNGKIAVSDSVSGNAAILIQNYANLTLSDISLDGTNLGKPHQSTGYCYTLSNNCGEVSIGNGVTIISNENHVAFDVCYSSSYYNAGTHVTVESGATINGLVAFDVWTDDSPINPASSLRINGGTFNGNLVVDGDLTEAAKSLIVIYGGTFSSNPSAYIAGGMEVVQPGDKYLVQKYVDRSSSSSSVKPEEPEQPEEPVVEPETPAAPGEVTSSTEVTDGGEVAFETPAGEDGSAPAAADDEVKGVVLPTGTEGTVEFVPVSEQPAPAGQEENTKRVFEINVPSYKKGEASVIKFQMTLAEITADGKTAADVALWHFDEETGEWTKLVTSFTIVDGIVYFEAITNDFSPFAIVYADEPAAELPTDQPEEPTETPASPAPVLAVIAALGAAVVLRRK